MGLPCLLALLDLVQEILVVFVHLFHNVLEVFGLFAAEDSPTIFCQLNALRMLFSHDVHLLAGLAAGIFDI